MPVAVRAIEINIVSGDTYAPSGAFSLKRAIRQGNLFSSESKQIEQIGYFSPSGLVRASDQFVVHNSLPSTLFQLILSYMSLWRWCLTWAEVSYSFSSKPNLELYNSVLLRLPRILVIYKWLELRRWDAWEHAHLDNTRSGAVWRFRLDRAAQKVSNVMYATLQYTYLPHPLQKNLWSGLPLNVSVSSNTFKVPSLSWMMTLSCSIIKLDDAKDPATLRQFAQWHICPRRPSNKFGSFRVTVIEPQRQFPVIPSLNSDMSCDLGSPVSGFVMVHTLEVFWLLALSVLSNTTEAHMESYIRTPAELMTNTPNCIISPTTSAGDMCRENVSW